jgi:transposase
MTGARIVHDTLEAWSWSVEIADAQRVKGLAPLACKTDKIDSMVLAVLSHRDLVPAIWLPDPRVRRSASSRASGCTSSSTSRRSSAASTRR